MQRSAMGSHMPRFRSIDASTLPKHFDAPGAEERWDRIWEETGIHRWDPARRKGRSECIPSRP